MKIGLSYSRCVRDLIEGHVQYDDVLVLVTRTNFDPNNDEQWSGIWRGYTLGGYSQAEWVAHADKEDQFRAMSCMLYNDGKMHQPRQFGANPRRLPYYWLEAVIPGEELNNNPVVKKAWEKFQTIAGLADPDLLNKSHYE